MRFTPLPKFGAFQELKTFHSYSPVGADSEAVDGLTFAAMHNAHRVTNFERECHFAGSISSFPRTRRAACRFPAHPCGPLACANMSMDGDSESENLLELWQNYTSAVLRPTANSDQRSLVLSLPWIWAWISSAAPLMQ